MASMLPLRRACSGGVLTVPPGTGADLLAAVNAKGGEDRSAWSAQAKAVVMRDPACPICFASPMEETMITPCGHAFCRDCIDGFLAQVRSSFLLCTLNLFFCLLNLSLTFFFSADGK